MATSTHPRNLEALILATGVFEFSDGAVSVADARAKGRRAFGNIKASSVLPEIETIEHEGSYEGKLTVDRRAAVKGALKYVIKPDEFGRQNMLIALGGNATTDFTQLAITGAAGTDWAFNTVNAVKDYWYDVLSAAGVRVRELTVLNIGVAAVACTVDAGTDVITKTTHGLSVGDRVIFPVNVPGGVTALTPYYVQSVPSADTFKISATSGGAAVDISTNGTSVTYSKLLAETAYTADLKRGSVRFAAAQTVALTPYITASAVVAGDNANLKGITPLQTLTRSGMGRLTLYDDTHPNKVVYDHVDFSCQVTFKSASETDAKKFGELEFEVLVTDIVGTVYTAED